MNGNQGDPWLGAGIAVAGLFGFLVVPVLLAYLLERRLVWAYVPLEKPGSVNSNPVYEFHPAFFSLAIDATLNPPTTPSAARAIQSAAALGFDSLGAFRDGKGKLYRVRYNFEISPDREVLAIIGGGRIGKIVVDSTWLITPLADGRRVTTVDQQSASSTDLVGLTDEALIPSADFGTLLASHRQRLTNTPAAIIPFSEHDPLAEERAFRVRRVDLHEEFGYVTYLDSSRSVWRYTFKGALNMTFRGFFRAFRRVLRPDSLLS